VLRSSSARPAAIVRTIRRPRQPSDLRDARRVDSNVTDIADPAIKESIGSMRPRYHRIADTIVQ
jgi:hypothetical protein